MLSFLLETVEQNLLREKSEALFAMGLTKFRGTVLASHGKLHAQPMLLISK
jgi:hypothetical protein